MALQTWAATSQLPRGGWHWSPRMNTPLIKANEAFFASASYAEEKQWQLEPPSHPTPRVHSCAPGMFRVSGDERDKKIHLDSCVSHDELNRLWPFQCFVMGEKRQDICAIKQLRVDTNGAPAINLPYNKQKAYAFLFILSYIFQYLCRFAHWDHKENTNYHQSEVSENWLHCTLYKSIEEWIQMHLYFKTSHPCLSDSEILCNFNPDKSRKCIYKEHNNRPKIKPCRTPLWMCNKPEVEPSNWISQQVNTWWGWYLWHETLRPSRI